MIAFTTVYGEVSWGVIFFFAGKEQELSWRYCQFRWGGQGTGAKGAKNRENDRAAEGRRRRRRRGGVGFALGTRYIDRSYAMLPQWRGVPGR